MIHPKVEQHIAAIRALCAEAGVTRLELCEGENPFFAGAAGPARFIVTLPTSAGTAGRAQTLATMEAQLATILGRGVELLLPGMLRNAWLREAQRRSRRELYPIQQ